MDTKSGMGNQQYGKRNKDEILNYIEKKCDSLENMLCKNMINKISKNVDSMEKNINYEYVKRSPEIMKYIETKSIEEENSKINKINQNFSIIENNFKHNLSIPDSNSSEIISKKIEENYMLLSELEKSKRPIFLKATDLSNSISIEEKLKEMDNKLGILFRSENAKNYSQRNIIENAIQFEESNYRHGDLVNYTFKEDIAEVKEETEIEKDSPQTLKEKKIKELYEKLDKTDKKIKEIAGNLLKNF